MRQVSSALIGKFRRTFCFPEPGAGRFIQDGTIGVVELPSEVFRYDRQVGYAFETAVVQERNGATRLFFVRIDSWDPAFRASLAPGELDYCIPLAYEGASERERLIWEIPFGGAWCDCREEALLGFDQRWRAWFAGIRAMLAFTNPGAESGALFRLQERDLAKLAEYRNA